VRSFFRSLLSGLLIITLAYVAYGAVMYRTYARAFEQTQKGDSLQIVLERFGTPSHIEARHSGRGYDSGSRSSCTESCWLRLWYEMPFTLGVSPLTVDFDVEQKVLDKYKWNSP